EIRGLVRRAQRLEATQFGSGGRVGETGELEDYPRPLVHFGHAETDLRSFSHHLDFGAGAHVAGAAGDLELRAVADQRDGWLRRRRVADIGQEGWRAGRARAGTSEREAR